MRLSLLFAAVNCVSSIRQYDKAFYDLLVMSINGKLNQVNQKPYTRGQRTNELNKLRADLLAAKRELDSVVEKVALNEMDDTYTARYSRFAAFHQN